jgi:hypothetical protein
LDDPPLSGFCTSYDENRQSGGFIHFYAYWFVAVSLACCTSFGSVALTLTINREDILIATLPEEMGQDPLVVSAGYQKLYSRH